MNFRLRFRIWQILHKGAMIAQGGPPKLRPQWRKVTSGPLSGVNLYLDPRDGAKMLDGSYDLSVVDALSKTGALREGATVWDVGAHIGYDTLMFASLVGSSGHVVAFEPNPHNVRYLQQHLERNPALGVRCELKSCALSNSDGTQEFRFSKLESLATIGHLNSSGPPSDRVPSSYYKSMETAVVSVNRADTLIADGVSVPDCMKIDVEGAELDVLKGAENLLRTHKPAVLIEVHNIRLMFEVQQFLTNCGYSMEFLDDPIRPSNSRAFLLASK